MRQLLLLVLFLSCNLLSRAQAPASYTASEIYQHLEKLQVLGSVLYIAAHPDDENTRLLAYLSNERLYRTGYMALTRGDGGQNLIGDEQGVELGLIRTQELLSARRIDGAEQFFSRAFDFGFTKTTQEALQTWGEDKILSDVVWVIRKFRPDIIITRFPEDERAGHGHHSASSVLAHEAFRAAADPRRFPEQFKYGVQPWQPKRIMWNTYSFGSINTTSNDQLKIEVGDYNPLLGKSIGEIAALSRSQHKSQGFGVAGSRGKQWEYFLFTEGQKARTDIMDDINTGWSRVPGGASIAADIDSIKAGFNLLHPEYSVEPLVRLYEKMEKLKGNYWCEQKLKELQSLIAQCSGLWMEATTNNEYAVQGGQIALQITLNNRLGSKARLLGLKTTGFDSSFNSELAPNVNLEIRRSLVISTQQPISQPYWLEKKMDPGSYQVDSQPLIGKPQNDPALTMQFTIELAGHRFVFDRPVLYRYTDPVKAELYEPLVVVPQIAVSSNPGTLIFRKQKQEEAAVNIRLTAQSAIKQAAVTVTARMQQGSSSIKDTIDNLPAGLSKEYAFTVSNKNMKQLEQDEMLPFAQIQQNGEEEPAYLSLTSITYDHIPHIHYFYQDAVKLLNIDLKTVGKKIGYIEGAGDKVPFALQQMGYQVIVLKESDLQASYLKQFDAIITGVRAYNVNDFMKEKYAMLMDYVKEGGNLIVQYNTSNYISNIRSEIGPYPFNISRNRVTDEKAAVHFLLPDHPVLNYPNKITSADFEGWIQERGIYFSDKADPAYQMPLSMADPNEPEQKGSLLIANYGKGTFVYTGLVFFRELPAGIPGAYRLLANIIALNSKKGF